MLDVEHDELSGAGVLLGHPLTINVSEAVYATTFADVDAGRAVCCTRTPTTAAAIAINRGSALTELGLELDSEVILRPAMSALGTPHVHYASIGVDQRPRARTAPGTARHTGRSSRRMSRRRDAAARPQLVGAAGSGAAAVSRAARRRRTVDAARGRRRRRRVRRQSADQVAERRPHR